MQEYLDFALEIAEYAKREMLHHFEEQMDLRFKEDRTVVTDVDKKINHYLIERVHEEYPTHSVTGEEESFSNSSSSMWVCDPIDGTGMYTDGVPVSVFSLAYVEDGMVQVGVVMDPYLNHTYTAIRGEGAYCDGKKISVNQKHLGDVGYRINFESWNTVYYSKKKTYSHQIFVTFGVPQGTYNQGISSFNLYISSDDATPSGNDYVIYNGKKANYLEGVLYNMDQAYSWGDLIVLESSKRNITIKYTPHYYKNGSYVTGNTQTYYYSPSIVYDYDTNTEM